MQDSVIIPAIDLIDGHIVRLHQGDYNQRTSYMDDPIKQFSHYIQQGATRLHLVDLAGAKDPNARQMQLIAKIIDATQAPIQIGGGIRAEKDINDLIAIGADRIIIGSTAVTQPARVKSWFEKFGADKLVLALDVRIHNDQKFIAIHGWQETSNLTLEQVIMDYSSVGLTHVLCTDISRDGTLEGSNVSLYNQLCQLFPQIKFQSSGGIGSLDDIKALTNTEVSGVIVGRALLEGKFTLKGAIRCWQNG